MKKTYVTNGYLQSGGMIRNFLWNTGRHQQKPHVTKSPGL